MRLGLVIHGSLNTLTGGFLYDRLLVEYLRRRGHTVRVIALAPRPYPMLLPDNFSPALFRRLDRSGIELLIEDALGHPALIGTNLRLRKRHHGLPVVALVHQVLCRQPRNAVHNRWLASVERHFFLSVDALLCNGHYTLAAVRRIAGHRHPALAAPPGGDRLGSIASAATILDRAGRSGPLELLLLANVTPNKGIKETIEALARVAGDGWRLNVAGDLEMDAAYANRVRRMAAARFPDGRIRFMGPLEGDALRDRLLAAHVLVLPFSVESFGICLLEAMAFGLPVLGSARGGGQRLIRHAWNGFQVLPGDFDGFSRHIETLRDDRERLAAMGIRARETFSRQPTWHESFAAVERFLASLLRNGTIHRQSIFTA